MSQEIIEYYARAIDEDMNSSRQLFTTRIMDLADKAENQDEEERQEIIMNEMLTFVFDEVTGDGRENPASMKFKNIDWDKLTEFQLKQVQNVCKEHFPLVYKSCETILVEGC